MFIITGIASVTLGAAFALSAPVKSPKAKSFERLAGSLLILGLGAFGLGMRYFP
ncbi:MAG: hypothetical protein KGQ46_00485 [Hyphomicrobiales bacterium]|nr:hypothetical protein [Hyphomicrobiales bacterium]MDE2116079.1 hypothetical protein [Hyphomicrobiales bacterium]